MFEYKKALNVIRKTNDGKTLLIGSLHGTQFGWRFFPMTSAHRPSRKQHATPKKAIPAWVGEYELVERDIDPS